MIRIRIAGIINNIFGLINDIDRNGRIDIVKFIPIFFFSVNRNFNPFVSGNKYAVYVSADKLSQPRLVTYRDITACENPARVYRVVIGLKGVINLWIDIYVAVFTDRGFVKVNIHIIKFFKFNVIQQIAVGFVIFTGIVNGVDRNKAEYGVFLSFRDNIVIIISSSVFNIAVVVPIVVLRGNNPYRPFLGMIFITLPAYAVTRIFKSAAGIKFRGIQLNLITAAGNRNIQRNIGLTVKPVNYFHKLVTGC